MTDSDRVSRASEGLAEAVTDTAAEVAAAATPPPQIQQVQTPPEPWIDLGQRLGSLESRLEQPFQDPRVDGLQAQIAGLPDQIMKQMQEADPIESVEEIAGDAVEAAGEVVEAVAEQAPKRAHWLLRRFGS